MEQIARGAGANGGRQHTAYEHVPLFMYGGICHRTGRNFCLAEMYHMWAWGFASRCTWNKILETLGGKARWCDLCLHVFIGRLICCILLQHQWIVDFTLVYIGF